MPITVIVRAPGGEDLRLTFDGTQRVVIGRGPGSDVRIPDASVSYRHASLRMHGRDFIVVDEGSTNGTFVGLVRVAPRTSRIVRSGDAVRIGRVWLELRTEQVAVTRDVAVATRDLALAIVSRAMAAIGSDPTTRIRVVEGPDQDARLPLSDEGVDYLVGRGPQCELPLADSDASREHARITRRDGLVYIRDLGAKNGTWMGDARLVPDTETVWRPAHMLRIGRSVLSLEEPAGDALAQIENALDVPLSEEEQRVNANPPDAAPANGIAPTGPAIVDAIAPMPSSAVPTPAVKRSPAWSLWDLAVMLTAMIVLVLSLVGLIWLLRS